MPQESIYYAVGRLSVLENTALDKSRIDRLLQASGLDEAERVLAEIGWPGGRDWEAGAARHMQTACTLLKELATDVRMVDAFLIRYDINNLKILLKARCLGQDSVALSPCGTVDPDVLARAVDERRYTHLPAVLKETLDALEKRLAIDIDPMDIDVTLDKAHYRMVFSLLSGRQKTVLAYFRMRVDLTNGAMALRAMHAGKAAQFIQGLLIEGGSIPVKEWEKAYAKPEKLPLLFNRFGPVLYAAAVAAYISPDKLAALEREADDGLLALYKPFRHAVDKDERLISYLLMREREAAAIRLIMAGKENGFDRDTMLERLRELYGR